MASATPPTKEYTTKQVLAESLWITIAWEWIQTFLGRAVDMVLWITMIVACVQLIPGVSLPPIVSNTSFVIQFIALDVGGLGLKSLCERYKLPHNSFAYRIAISLIVVTLVTVTFAGIEHAFPTMSQQVITVVEVILVVIRSLLTVFYGVAVRSMKSLENAELDHIADLEQEVGSLRVQLDNEQDRVSTLQEQLKRHEQQSTLLQKELRSAQQEMSQLQQDFTNEQQRASNLQEELSTGQGDTTTLRKQLSTAISEVETLKGHLEDKGRSLDQVQQRLAAEQQRSATLSNELDAGQGDTTSLRRQLGVALSDAELLRSQLESKGVEVGSLKELLAGNSGHLRQQLETEQATSVTLRQDLQSVKLQVVDLTSQLAEATRYREKLQNAEGQVQDLASKLDQKDEELVVVSNHLRSAKLTIVKLQEVEKQVENLTTELQEKEQECERAKGQISQLTVKLRESKSVKESTLSQGNITSIDQARVKVKASDNEIIAYMKEHPGMKVPEVASHFEVTPRTIYNVLKRQETGDETCETEAVGEA